MQKTHRGRLGQKGKVNMLHTLTRRAEIGDFILFERGAWRRRERVPAYLVSRESSGRDLKDFLRFKTALAWINLQQADEARKGKP